MSKEGKQKLKEYQKNYHKAKNYIKILFFSYSIE